MRPDAPTTRPLSPPTERAYAARWAEWKPFCLLAMNGDRSPERLSGYQSRHRDRLIHLQQVHHFSMYVIVRNSLDDPRLSVSELQSRIRTAREMREKMNPWKNKKGGKQNGNH